jgi:hypothetical protein
MNKNIINIERVRVFQQLVQKILSNEFSSTNIEHKLKSIIKSLCSKQPYIRKLSLLTLSLFIHCCTDEQELTTVKGILSNCCKNRRNVFFLGSEYLKNRKRLTKELDTSADRKRKKGYFLCWAKFLNQEILLEEFNFLSRKYLEKSWGKERFYEKLPDPNTGVVWIFKNAGLLKIQQDRLERQERSKFCMKTLQVVDNELSIGKTDEENCSVNSDLSIAEFDAKEFKNCLNFISTRSPTKLVKKFEFNAEKKDLGSVSTGLSSQKQDTGKRLRKTSAFYEQAQKEKQRKKISVFKTDGEIEKSKKLKKLKFTNFRSLQKNPKNSENIKQVSTTSIRDITAIEKVGRREQNKWVIRGLKKNKSKSENPRQNTTATNQKIQKEFKITNKKSNRTRENKSLNKLFQLSPGSTSIFNKKLSRFRMNKTEVKRKPRKRRKIWNISRTKVMRTLSKNSEMDKSQREKNFDFYEEQPNTTQKRTRGRSVDWKPEEMRGWKRNRDKSVGSFKEYINKGTPDRGKQRELDSPNLNFFVKLRGQGKAISGGKYSGQKERLVLFPAIV